MDLNPELFKEELKQREAYREAERQEMIKENLMNVLMGMKFEDETPKENNIEKGE